ncbi:hypothetical protein BJX76DRAFT_353310 [Aspergillus varians]
MAQNNVTTISKITTPSQSEEPAAYGSYEELVKDTTVHILYIASPHSYHFQNCMLALENNKPIFCEKPLPVNAAQAKILYETARKKIVFLLEASCTRFFSPSVALRQYIPGWFDRRRAVGLCRQFHRRGYIHARPST